VYTLVNDLFLVNLRIKLTTLFMIKEFPRCKWNKSRDFGPYDDCL